MSTKVKLGLKSHSKAYDIVRSVRGQISDGIWENSRRMDEVWRSFTVSEENGEIIITANDSFFWHFPAGGGSDREGFLKVWLANMIKKITKTEMGDSPSPTFVWKRDNTHPVHYLDYNSGVTVADAYCIYDFLKGRKIRDRERSIEMLVGDSIVYRDLKIA